MSYNGNSQISGHHNSTTVWTQPSTDDQRRYYSKHAAEKRVFGWITTIFQTAHGFIAFAAWTAIYLWVFQKVPLLLPFAPVLSGFTLMALHVLFRVTWQTFWYDKLDNDPNTDSPIWVPLIIIVVLLFAEVQGAQQFLAGQVKPPEKQGTETIDADHSTTVASLDKSYSNDKEAIEATYKQRERAATLPYDRQIYNARRRSADTPEERRARNSEIATLSARRDAALAPVLAEKAKALDQAYTSYKTSKDAATSRRDQALVQVDNANTAEITRHTTELSNVGTYSWVLSVSLLLLIAGLSYRVVRINVKSGILPLRNYTVLDAHGSIPERIWTALTDALNRRSLQFAVFLHRIFSPRREITSFDGTVVARPGTYNTPKGFYNSENSVNSANSDSDDEETLRKKVADKILQQAARGEVKITPEMLNEEFQKARQMNGHYKDTPLGKTEPSPAPAPQDEGRTHAPHHPTYDELLHDWRRRVEAQLAAYDRHIIAGEPGKAQAIQDYVFTDPTSPIVKEGRRLNLEWGVQQGQFVVRHREYQHYVPLENISEAALKGTTPSPAPPTAEFDDELFKQTPELFKQIIIPHTDEEGTVIGIKYKKWRGGWTTYDYNTVRGQWGIYLRRAQKGEVSQAVTDGLEKWEYAMSLFEEGRRELRDNLQTVTL